MKNIEYIEFRDALLEINEKMLNLDYINILLGICPREEEIKLIKEYSSINYK